MSIQRWEPMADQDEPTWMERDGAGDYVLFTDHAAAISALESKLAAAESLLEAFNRESVTALAIRERDEALAKLSAAEARIGRLRKLALRTHHTCEDSFYSCPKSPEGCYNEGAGTECNCGADQHNAEVERICNDTPPQAEGD